MSSPIPRLHMCGVFWLGGFGALDCLVALRSDLMLFWFGLIVYAILVILLFLTLRAAVPEAGLAGRLGLVGEGAAIVVYGTVLAIYAIDPIAVLATAPVGIGAVVKAVWPRALRRQT